MRQHWYKGPVLGDHAPPYAAKGPGNAGAGEAVYSDHCAMCHGEVSKDATGQLKVDPGAAGPLINSSLLALITPQAIRTTVIVGRPDLGMPDWRDEPGSTLSDADITNVVAFLEAQRPARPGEVFGQPQQLAPVPKRPDMSPHHPAFTNRTKTAKGNQ
jgi:cytochrome c oxidase cbb3-type subunit 3